ncbi:uncharacterized protein LOC131947723 [Physella acuta]|uniref:uncharacterized protein LOC131947723 n=1 Tax=Physella acuta TaxID=109671 RepID=UPI0027DAC423|nr:uncharacterized protein LOC131947723 [Physella acuta]
MLVILVLVSCLPYLSFGQDVSNVAYESFRKIDANHDGHITKPELVSYFDNFDLNNDGHVTKLEYAHHVDQVYHEAAANRIMHQIFGGLDTDNNGHLNHADYDDIFNLADANNNNYVSDPEYERYFKIIAT